MNTLGRTKEAKQRKGENPSPYTKQAVRCAYVEVIGTIWMPATTAAYRYDLRDYDLENIGRFTRANVEQWLSTNSGDFQNVTDFRAVCGKHEIPWKDEESEFTYNDCMHDED